MTLPAGRRRSWTATPELRARFAPLVPLFERMDELAKLMRKRRYERGSLDFDLPEPKLVLDAAGEMTGIVAPPAARQHARDRGVHAGRERGGGGEGCPRPACGALFRIHEQPDPERVEEFRELVASLGYRVPGQASRRCRPQDFQLILRQIEGKPEEKLVSYLLLRTMKLARYHEENLGPLRPRHRDVRALHEPDPPLPGPGRAPRAAGAAPAARRPRARGSARERLPEMGRHLSEMERRRQRGRARADRVEEGPLHGGQARRGVLRATSPASRRSACSWSSSEVYVQGLVHVSSMTDDYYTFDERAHTLKGENTRQGLPAGRPGGGAGGARGPRARKIDFALARRAGAQGRAARPRAVRPRWLQLPAPGVAPARPRSPAAQEHATGGRSVAPPQAPSRPRSGGRKSGRTGEAAASLSVARSRDKARPLR